MGRNPQIIQNNHQWINFFKWCMEDSIFQVFLKNVEMYSKDNEQNGKRYFFKNIQKNLEPPKDYIFNDNCKLRGKIRSKTHMWNVYQAIK